MAVRSRTTTVPRNQGTCTVLFGANEGRVYYDGMTQTQYDKCDDDIIVGDCGAFDMTHWQRRGGLVNTINPDPLKEFSNYMVTGFGGFTPITTFTGQKPNGTYMTEALARTNPSRPYVDVPVAVFELGDITQLLKRTGDNLIKRGAGKYLEYQFLWKPLISDLFKLTNFHEQVARRVKEIKKLQGQTGLRKTVDLDSLSATKTWQWDPNSNNINVPHQECNMEGRRIIRGHVRWLPLGDLRKMPDQELVKLAKKSVLGLTADLSTLWELMPWSWLIDWGWNIGSYLKANRNIIPARYDKGFLSVHTVNNVSFHSEVVGNHEMSSGSWTHERKQRIKHAATPVAHFPFLSESQLGIVAALAITRA